MKFKVVKNLPDSVLKSLDIVNNCVYQVFMEDRYAGTYKSIKVDPDWTREQKWYKKQMDLNEANKNVGYPPHYIVCKRSEKIEDILKKEFPKLTKLISIGSELNFEVENYELPDYKRQ